MNWRKWSVVVLAAGALLAAGCSRSGAGKDQADPGVPVRVAVAREDELSASTSATGQVRPRLEVRVSARIPGRVAAVMADLGDAVTAGQVLAELDGNEAQIQLRQAEAGVAQATAQAAEAERNLQRMRQLYGDGVVSKQQSDQAATGAQLARGQLRAAEAALELAQSQVDNTRIAAPAGGVISKRSVEPGALVGAGTVLFELVDVSQVTVEAGVAERDVNRVRAGQEVSVRVPAIDRSFTGRVAGISPAVDPRTGLFATRVTVDNPDGVLRGGMFAEVTLDTRLERGIAVPVDALVDRGGATLVYVVENGTAWQRQVEVAFRAGDRALVTGIPAGATVVVVGHNLLQEGAAVRVVEPGEGS